MTKSDIALLIGGLSFTTAMAIVGSLIWTCYVFNISVNHVC